MGYICVAEYIKTSALSARSKEMHYAMIECIHLSYLALRFRCTAGLRALNVHSLTLNYEVLLQIILLITRSSVIFKKM